MTPAPGRLSKQLLVGLVRALYTGAGRLLVRLENGGRAAEAAAAGESVTPAMRQTQAAGRRVAPPAHWVEVVSRHAPQLLRKPPGQPASERAASRGCDERGETVAASPSTLWNRQTEPPLAGGENAVAVRRESRSFASPRECRDSAPAATEKRSGGGAPTLEAAGRGRQSFSTVDEECESAKETAGEISRGASKRGVSERAATGSTAPRPPHRTAYASPVEESSRLQGHPQSNEKQSVEKQGPDNRCNRAPRDLAQNFRADEPCNGRGGQGQRGTEPLHCECRQGASGGAPGKETSTDSPPPGLVEAAGRSAGRAAAARLSPARGDAGTSPGVACHPAPSGRGAVTAQPLPDTGAAVSCDLRTLPEWPRLPGESCGYRSPGTAAADRWPALPPSSWDPEAQSSPGEVLQSACEARNAERRLRRLCLEQRGEPWSG
jgi:hypothetical protein